MISTVPIRWAAIILITLVLAGGLAAASGVSAQNGAADVVVATDELGETQALPVTQVTIDLGEDYWPALVQASDGRLLAAFGRYGGLWSRASTDGGATWGAETQIDGCCRYSPSLARTADGSLWLSYDREGDVWYRTSIDHGVTWSSERRLTADPEGDFDAIILQAADGKMWAVWCGYRSGHSAIWYKTSADGGASWTPDTRLSVSSGTENYAPAATAAPDGRLLVAWVRGNGELWQRSSADGGTTWSAEMRVTACCRGNPSLATIGDSLWLAYEKDWDVWYRTSTNQGVSWSAEASFTRFVGGDWSPALAAMTPHSVGIVWTSGGSGNPDIWFGSPGVREDINPPPYVDWIEHRPQINPDADDIITFCARALDETGVAGVDLVWSLDGTPQDDLPMFDDGTHGDDTIGDGVWCTQHAALPEGRKVAYQARATDTDGNGYLSGQNGFVVLPPFLKTAGVLFVPDGGGGDTGWFRSYYAAALEAMGYAYDTWDTGLRAAPDSAALNEYAAGTVIWAAPSEGYINRENDTRAALQSYLDAGGRLLITGQNIAQSLAWSGNAGLLSDYLHASFRQPDTGLYGVSCDGLQLNISGGDGANNQYSKDEVDPIAPADVFCTYLAGASARLDEPIRPEEEAPGKAPAGPPGAGGRPASAGPGAAPRDASAGPAITPAVAPSVAPAGCVGSCAAALRIDTVAYKVVYLAFGVEAINTPAGRAAVMERGLAWLNDVAPRPAPATPRNGQTVPAGAVDFSWIGIPGVVRYEIQIDTAETFDSPDLIDVTVSGTGYRHTFGSYGKRYWRVRAQPDGAGPGAWTFRWLFSIAGDVVQVTTDPANDLSPALVQTAGGSLLTVFVRDGNLWSRASTDGGATWGTEVRVDGCCRYNPSLARAADGVLWLAYDRDDDIWYRSSADHGATWSAETKLLTDVNSQFDSDPVIFQAADGKLWVVWQSHYRPENYEHAIWYKTSADGGATWSADTRLTRDAYDYAPAAAVTARGRIVVVWQRLNEMWQRSSDDGGATWSEEEYVAGWERSKPSLAADGETLWLAYAAWDDDIRYRTSTDDADTWSEEVRFTRFAGGDDAPGAAALAVGGAGIAWSSGRGGNPDIWFGAPAGRDDLNPPPYIAWLDHRPAPNPEADDPIAFRVRALDEAGVAAVHLVWTLNGIAQGDLLMYDDGTHGDAWAGDGVWSILAAPLPEGSQVDYRARATDTDGRSYRYPALNTFKVLPPFVKRSAILFVPDAGGNNTPADTAWFRRYYTDALEALGYRCDTWDAGLRGAPGSAILGQYTRGAVIWAVPYWGVVTGSGSEGVSAFQAYLDGGGKLFITGQNVAEALRWGNPGFLDGYLHAAFRQSDTGLYALAGAAGDPIGDGLALNISGGDGANDQYSKDEVEPIAPAEVIFNYRAGVSAMLAQPAGPQDVVLWGLQPDALDGSSIVPALTPAPAPSPAPTAAPPPIPTAAPPVPTAAPPYGCTGSCTAGLRVEAGKYRLVYFAFGFEAINRAADRQEVMARVLDWLTVGEAPKVYLPLIISQSSAADAFWADLYQLEPGACTTLHWSVTNAQAVYLNDEGVTGLGSRVVCPAATTTYVLRVVRAGGTAEHQLTITVADGG
jgi:hypothetical protein